MTHLQSEKANLSKYKGTSSPCCAVMGIMGIALTFESFIASSASNNLYLPLSGLPSSASRHDSLFNADLICMWFLAVACGERGDGRLSDCVPKGIEHGPELEIGGCSYCRYRIALGIGARATGEGNHRTSSATDFFRMNLAAPECGVGCANSAEARGVSSVSGMGLGRLLPTGVGAAGELGWISPRYSALSMSLSQMTSSRMPSWSTRERYIGRSNVASLAL